MVILKIPLVLLLAVSMLLLVHEGRLANSMRTDYFGEIYPRVVNITNDLGLGIGLTIRCKSKDDDLGQHDLPFQSSFSWSFKSNVIIQNTDFYCYMWWQSVSGSFDVYKASRDDERCADKCWWSIKQLGAFSYDEAHDRWDLVYIWKK